MHLFLFRFSLLLLCSLCCSLPQPIPVIFQYTAEDLGFLDEQSMDEQHVRTHTQTMQNPSSEGRHAARVSAARLLIACGSCVATGVCVQLAQESRVEVPLWLATTLAIRSYVTLELPRVFQPAFREMLLADPAVVDLHSKCSYFYEFGIKIATLSESTHTQYMVICSRRLTKGTTADFLSALGCSLCFSPAVSASPIWVTRCARA